MKKTGIILFVLLITFRAAYAQSDEVQQLLLNVEKLAQLKQILSDMKKGYNIVSKGYSTVKDLSQGNFNLHKAFLDGLLEVSPAVRKYKKITETVRCQLELVKEYRKAITRFRQSGHFTESELAYMGRVYERLFQRSLENLDELTMVVTSGTLRMSDDERITSIDRIHRDMQDKLNFLRSFNSNISLLGLQRAKDHHEVNTMRRIYGIKD